MNKAIFYKERIKIRRFYPLAIAVLAGFTAYALLRIGRMYAFNGAASVWLAVLDRGDVLVDPLKYLPALVGAGLGLAQFLPEITQKRLKLTLHLPDSRRAMMLGMLGYGLVLLTMLFAVQLLAIGLYLRHLMAPELVHAVVSTTLPWYAAGFAGYLFAAWICIEPTWRQRLFDALIAAGYRLWDATLDAGDEKGTAVRAYAETAQRFSETDAAVVLRLHHSAATAEALSALSAYMTRQGIPSGTISLALTPINGADETR